MNKSWGFNIKNPQETDILPTNNKSTLPHVKACSVNGESSKNTDFFRANIINTKHDTAIIKGIQIENDIIVVGANKYASSGGLK